MLLNATHILVKHAVIKADLLLKTENVESQKKPTEKTRNRLSGLRRQRQFVQRKETLSTPSMSDHTKAIGSHVKSM